MNQVHAYTYKTQIIIFTILLSFCWVNSLSSQCNVICNTAPNQNDFDALKQLYCDTDGENWKNNDGWYESLNQGLGCNYCEWFGVTCEDGRVVELELLFNRLNGPLPSKISKLKKLRRLQLSANDITGPLPGSIGLLTELEELWIASNEFHSPMPPEIGQLVNLKLLNVDYAPFTGPIPEEIGNLVNLEYLNLVDNFFTSYPQSLGNLTKLKGFQMWDSFTDSLPFPDFLGNFPDLETLRIAGDAMTGSFPIELFNHQKLRGVSLDDNQLTGQLPEMALDLDSLLYFNVSRNELEGEFLLDFTACEKFNSLNISNNNFSGSFPEGFGNIETLTRITANNNNFNGCFPTDLYNKCDEYIYFSKNEAMSFKGDFDDFCESDGTLEAQIGSKCDDGVGSSELDFIDSYCECIDCEHPDANALLKLYYSSFNTWTYTGTKSAPDSQTEGWGKDCDICKWYGITCIDNRVTKIKLDNNGLSQSISSEFQDLPFLEELDLSNNSINSELPKLISMDNLKSINLSDNQFYKTLPEEWSTKSNLENIDLHNNVITGFIPASYDTFTNLEFIDFSTNRLNGNIPFNATSNPFIKKINLRYNAFTGNLPSALGEIESLYDLNLSVNLFEGCIPESYRSLCSNGTLNLIFNNALSWQGETTAFCEAETIDDQDGTHCGYNGAGYIEDCQCLNSTFGCDIPEEILCKPWVQNFAQTLICSGMNRYSIFTSVYGNIPVVMFSQGLSIGSEVVSTQYIYTCDGILLENCSFSLGSNCVYDQSIYKQIQDDLVQIFHCQDDQFPTDCDDLCSHPDMPALMSFYGASNGESWADNTGWADGFNGTNCDPCDGWFGVDCNDQGRVVNLSLMANNLSGNIPSAVTNLEELLVLALGGNFLHGKILPKLHRMTKLDLLGLQNNLLTGSIPDFEIELPKLTFYLASGNDLNTIPDFYKYTPNMESIFLSRNNFSEELDHSIFLLENLTFLDLSDNNISGTLPEEIANGPNFHYMDLKDNQLSGQVPEVFGSLSEISQFLLSNNNLDGILPDTLRNLTKSFFIRLDENQFSGPLPKFILDLGNTHFIDLKSNNFEGCIDPSFLSLCDSSVNIVISDNPLLENDDWYLFCDTQEGICESQPPMNSTPYYPMAIENANWIFEAKDFDTNTTNYYGWRIEGDTIINGIAYKKGFKIDVEHLIAPPYQELFYSIDPDNPVFFMRDDTLNKKVYAIYEDLQDPYNCQTVNLDEEVLVYDFEPNINDSIYCPDGIHIVSNIDTVEYFGYNLPRYNINNNNRIQYHQIGDPEGLFFDINYVFIDTYSERLIEYCVREEIGCYHMFDPLATNEINDDSEVMLYPNPAVDKITISTAQGISSIDIFTIDGRRILSIEDIGSNKSEISLEGQPSQILLAVINLEDGNIVRKMFAKH